MKPQEHPRDRWLRAVLVMILAIAIPGLTGCANDVQSDARAIAPEQSPLVGKSTAPDANHGADTARLQELWNERANDGFSSDFAIGPGDVLQVSVPDMEELKDRKVRVSGDDTIALPVVGVLHVGGMNEEQVRQALRHRLEKYMNDPEVDVFVKEYQSRQVAVEGMVQKPGLYTLSSRSDTILDLISRAGGMTENASTRIIFVPSNGALGPSFANQAISATNGTSQADHAQIDETTSGREMPARPMRVSVHTNPWSQDAGNLPITRQGTPIVLDLATATEQSNLNVPARPGDVVIVPAAGQVMVKGWVQNPGAFKITPGMTVLGAVTAAGGELFSSDARLLRSAENGDMREISVDLGKVQKGAEADVTVQSGDVVVVARSLTGAVPYAVYQVFSKFGTGLYPAVPLF